MLVMIVLWSGGWWIVLQVQESVASCLPPLVPAIKEDAGGMIQKLMQLLLESDKYAERKGAAYGLAGLVKGLGILSLKQQEMMTTLTDAIQDKKNFRRREGKEQEFSPPETSLVPTTIVVRFPAPLCLVQLRLFYLSMSRKKEMGSISCEAVGCV